MKRFEGQGQEDLSEGERLSAPAEMLLIFGTSGQHSSRSAFGPTTGNDISGHYKQRYFLFPVFLRCLLFS